jgi:uncharacterized membrane protein
MWANLHLLFWICLIPFSTDWMAENHFSSAPTALYGFVLLMASLAYSILQNLLVKVHPKELERIIGTDLKGKLSLVFYIVAIILSCYYERLAQAIYALVAAMWFIPDKRFEFLSEYSSTNHK